MFMVADGLDIGGRAMAQAPGNLWQVAAYHMPPAPDAYHPVPYRFADRPMTTV